MDEMAMTESRGGDYGVGTGVRRVAAPANYRVESEKIIREKSN